MARVDASLKSTETRDELSTTCQDACQHLMLHIPTSLPQEQAAKTDKLSVVSI